MLNRKKRTHHFEIASSSTVRATPVELSAIVLDPDALSQWGRGVFTDSQVVERGADDGLGMTIRACSKGWIPHGFAFLARVVDLDPHKWMKVMLSGDFKGSGFLSAKPVDDDHCTIYLRLDVEVQHPYLRLAAVPLKPLFLLNHKWAAQKATRLLQQEVYRRRKAAAAGNR